MWEESRHRTTDIATTRLNWLKINSILILFVPRKLFSFQKYKFKFNIQKVNRQWSGVGG